MVNSVVSGDWLLSKTPRINFSRQRERFKRKTVEAVDVMSPHEGMH
jgi:hypothetical protein